MTNIGTRFLCLSLCNFLSFILFFLRIAISSSTWERILTVAFEDGGKKIQSSDYSWRRGLKVSGFLSYTVLKCIPEICLRFLHVIWTREEQGISIYEGSQWKDHHQTGRINKHFHHVNVKLEWRATSIQEDFTCLFHFCNRIYLLFWEVWWELELQILHINILHTLCLAFKSSTTRSSQ